MRHLAKVLALFCVLAGSLASHAQSCDAWKQVIGWTGTYTLTSNGQFSTGGGLDLYTIAETTGAVVDMPTMVDGLCNQLRWQGPDDANTGTVNDSTQVLNGCTQGVYFLYDTLIGNTGYQSNSELEVDVTDGTFSFQPIPHDFATHTIYACDGGEQQQGVPWGTGPGDNWPLNFQLPSQVGPLTITNFPFSAKSQYAGDQDIAWTITFNLTPVLANQKTLSVSIRGNGSVTSTDGFINCPGACTHSYTQGTQVTLNATPAQGSTFIGWGGACSGAGSCTVTMNEALSVEAIFSSPLEFVAYSPCRVVDTRGPDGPPLQGGQERSFSPLMSPCSIPPQAAAYSLNVTVVPQGSLGYLTVWPTGENRPVVSTMNSLDGRVKATAAIVPAGDGGGVSFYPTDTTNLVVDIDGYFVPAGMPGQVTSQFYTLPPCRVIDTRNASGDLGGPNLSGGVVRDFPVLESSCIPQGPAIQGYSFNVTAVPHPAGKALYYLTVWDEGSPKPLVSTLNNFTATIVANAALVPAGSGGGISVFASDDTDLVVDINGYFAAPGASGLSLYPLVPCRALDTRNNHGQPFTGEKTVDVAGSTCAPPNTAQAYVLNATVVPQGGLGYLTLWPDGVDRPVASTLNALDGAITSNMAIVPTSNGSIDAYASGTTHLVLDISSYFAP